jgi:hypothetical protein
VSNAGSEDHQPTARCGVFPVRKFRICLAGQRFRYLWILHFIGSFQYKLKTYLFKITFNRDIILRFAPNSFASFLIHVALLDLITLKVLREKQIL